MEGARSGGGGYFGKLPDRADFVSATCPPGFLRLWEPFLIGGLAQSRIDLEDTWEEAYMTMPVWRFWLRPDEEDCVLTQAVAGAFMPSVDKVGREFPLTFVAAAGPEHAGNPPAENWYDTVENALRSALEDDTTLSEFKAVTSRIEPAVPQKMPEDRTDAAELAGDGQNLFSTFWCRAGTGLFAFRSKGLPEAAAFRWFLLPEMYPAPEDQGAAADNNHGRYHPEDNRT